MALRLQQLRGPALVRPALKVRPASTSSSTSTSDQSSPGPRRYRLTVDAVSSGLPTSTDPAFRMKTDVEGFSDDEVKVTVADGAVTVQAEQERTTDGGRFSRRVYRRVTLPPGVEEGQVTVRREGGAVIVEAPLPQ
ncbi:Major egg antigen [Amphibalanus amphitrite]|uniref:Major egg antigen n=1 Tax=Amphibalanus amphitrite TaxID=1232801 RepID=A0A6A4VEY1_AMPAM|nr:Major egg antigen [Amphibalanus amphitrite]